MSIVFKKSREIKEETFTINDIVIKFINTSISVVDDEPIEIFIESLPASIIEKLEKEKEKDEPLQIIYEVKNCSINSSFTLGSPINGVVVEESYFIIRESNPFIYFSIDDIHIESKRDDATIVLESSTIYIHKNNTSDNIVSLNMKGREGIKLENSSLYLCGSEINIYSSYKPILLKNTKCMLRVDKINLSGKVGIEAYDSFIYVDYEVVGTINIDAGLDCIESNNGTIIINLNRSVLDIKTKNQGILLHQSLTEYNPKLLMNIGRNLDVKSGIPPAINNSGLLIFDIHEYTSLNLSGGINNQHNGILKTADGEFSFRNSDNESFIEFDRDSDDKSTIGKSSFREVVCANKYSLDYNTGDVKYTNHKGELHDKKIEITKKLSAMERWKLKKNQKKE